MLETLNYDTQTVRKLMEGIQEGRFALPRYQRGISWTESQQRALITSIHQGFPIGSLLVHLVESSSAGNKYTIVDGLQRTTALRKYMENQGHFVTPDSLNDNWVKEFMRVLKDEHNVLVSLDQARNDLYSYVSQIEDFSKLQRLNLYQFLVSKYSLTIDFTNTSAIDGRWDHVHETISKGLDISEYPIPIIAYQGSADLLPEIFERLNSNVVKLNKYQIVAASWSSQALSTDINVANEINAYWFERQQEVEGLQIDGIDDIGHPSQLFLFDYLLGLGRHLCKTFPLLFEASWGDTIAFQIATVAHGLRLTEMSKLEGAFGTVRRANTENVTATYLDCDAFTKAIVESCKSLEISLRPRIGLKLNAAGGVTDQHPGHTVLQIASMVVNLCVNSFDGSNGWKKIAGNLLTPAVTRNIQDSYLLGRVDNFWSSSGDSKFFRAVWGGDDSAADQVSRNRAAPLFPPVDRGQLRSALEAWFESELQRRDKKRVSVNSETKTVLKYFYSNKILFADNFGLEYHLDHLVPVAWWRKSLEYLTESTGAPFNSIGNIALMTQEDNASKGGERPLIWKERRLDMLEGAKKEKFEQDCSDLYFLVPDALFQYSEELSDLEQKFEPTNPEAVSLLMAGLRNQSEQRWSVILSSLVSQ